MRKNLICPKGLTLAPGGLLYDLVGQDGCLAIADEILEGTFDVNQLSDLECANVTTLIAFVQQMARPTKDEVPITGGIQDFF